MTWLYRAQPSHSLGPPPLGVSVIDLSIVVFGRTFPRAANKHRLQMLNHFTECLKSAKAARLEVTRGVEACGPGVHSHDG